MAGSAVPAAGHRGPVARSVQRDVQDLVVAVVRRAVLVTAARGDPEAAVRARLDRPQPAELALEERLRLRGAVALDLHDPQPGAAQRGHVERAVDIGQTARRGLGHRPGLYRVGETPPITR